MLMKFYNHHQPGSMAKIFMADDYDEDNYDINYDGGDFPSGECIYCSAAHLLPTAAQKRPWGVGGYDGGYDV